LPLFVLALLLFTLQYSHYNYLLGSIYQKIIFCELYGSGNSSVISISDFAFGSTMVTCLQGVGIIATALCLFAEW